MTLSFSPSCYKVYGEIPPVISSSVLQDNRDSRVPRQSWPLLRHQSSLELFNGHLTGCSTAGLFGIRISYDWDCISFHLSPYSCSLAPLTNSTVLVPRLLLSKHFGCNMCYTLGLREWADRLQAQICGMWHGQRSLRHSPSSSVRSS